MNLLPQPKDLKGIALMYGLNRFFSSKRNLVGKTFRIDRYISRLMRGDILKPKTAVYDRMNVYFLNRSMHQANEACNKLWATLELYYGMKTGKKLCRRFNENFLPTSTIPTLHYANISALLSILSLFGVASIAYRKGKLRFYNLVRTADGIILIERNRYLSEIFGMAKRGWHEQILQMYGGLRRKGIRLPEIDMEDCRRLMKARLKYHYDILGQTTMKDVYGVEKYFDLLPVVVRSIRSAVESLCRIVGSLSNKCDSRFNELLLKLPDVAREYGVKFNLVIDVENLLQ